MSKKLTPKQQINAELVSRSFNQRAKDVIKHSNPPHEVTDLLIEFVCECSDASCKERVALTIRQYENIHTDQATFVLVSGHQQAPVDKVKINAGSFTIVEKPALSPATD